MVDVAENPISRGEVQASWLAGWLVADLAENGSHNNLFCDRLAHLSTVNSRYNDLTFPYDQIVIEEISLQLNSLLITFRLLLSHFW